MPESDNRKGQKSPVNLPSGAASPDDRKTLKSGLDLASGAASPDDRKTLKSGLGLASGAGSADDRKTLKPGLGLLRLDASADDRKGQKPPLTLMSLDSSTDEITNLRIRPQSTSPPSLRRQQPTMSENEVLAALNNSAIFRASSGIVAKNPAAEIKARAKQEIELPSQERIEALQALMSSDPDPSLVGTSDIPAPTMIGRFLANTPAAGTSAPSGGDGTAGQEELIKALSAAQLLRDIPEEQLHRAKLSGKLTLLSYNRDALIELPDRVLIVANGQVALAYFDPAVLAKERQAQQSYVPDKVHGDKAEYRRRMVEGPVIRLSQRNLAVYDVNELIAIPASPAGKLTPTLFAVTPVKVLSIARSTVEDWAKRFPRFADRRTRAVKVSHERIASSEYDRGDVADFYIRQGKSIATTLRVRDVGKCIECYSCEKACEDRYGAQRLFLNGKVLGTLDFVNTCQTCTDQRCVEACTYDAISFNVLKGEVLINEDNCTGCTLCSRACPYDAITMYELVETPTLKARLERDRAKRQTGRGRDGDGGKTQGASKLASKCDHCIDYPDQACITACPTDALLELTTSELFLPRTEKMIQAAEDGYDRSVMVTPEELFRIDPFLNKGGKADPNKREQLSIDKHPVLRSVWLTSVALWVVCAAEAILRTLRPTWSLQYYYLTSILKVPAGLAKLDVVYRPSGEFGVWLGRLGGVLMFSTLFYSWFVRTKGWQRLPLLRRMNPQAAFGLHEWAGFMGAAFLFLHSALRLRPELVSTQSLTAVMPLAAFWLLVAVIVSGIIGRYLAPKTPTLAQQAMLQGKALQQDLARLRNQHAGVLAADLYFERLSKRYARVVGEPSQRSSMRMLLGLLFLLYDVPLSLLRSMYLRLSLDGIKDRTARRKVAQLVTRLASLYRQEQFTPLFAPIVSGWRVVHVPLAILLTVVGLGHVLFEEVLRRILEGGG